jgi:hypothetical protein
VKQEHYTNNKLQDYRVYKYDSSSRLIKDLYINPENESGESLKTSEASGTYINDILSTTTNYSNTRD